MARVVAAHRNRCRVLGHGPIVTRDRLAEGAVREPHGGREVAVPEWT
ncbi:hypothetical protein [Micromonospora terminaliae]|uniref:Uncharacterized protein n=1 Tax=Micromonospora terminaliae TaxID=1914461 RepID=A0AAJ3DM73_9ACTN|nr:hypothetical protein [Micromonospora terminaliae]NES31576.1 hypothetical protein [Micromonospora terminaliae]